MGEKVRKPIQKAVESVGHGSGWSSSSEYRRWPRNGWKRAIRRMGRLPSNDHTAAGMFHPGHFSLVVKERDQIAFLIGQANFTGSKVSNSSREIKDEHIGNPGAVKAEMATTDPLKFLDRLAGDLRDQESRSILLSTVITGM